MKKTLKYILPGSFFAVLLILSAICSDVWYDDAGHYRVALNLSQTNALCYPVNNLTGECLKGSPFITSGPVLHYPLAGWMKVFGAGILSSRIFMCMLSLISMLVFIRLAQESTDLNRAMTAGLMVAVNIQFNTYGAQVLGEVPMILFLLLGILFLKKSLEGNWMWVFFAWMALSLSILSKLYISVPIGLGLAVCCIFLLFRKEFQYAIRISAIGLMLPLLPILYMSLSNDGLKGTLVNLSVYQAEFLSLDLLESLRFIALKPVIWLGYIAMLVRLRLKPSWHLITLTSLQTLLMLFFLLSAGYDRIGMILVFLPAIYLAEFVFFAWDWFQKRKQPVLKWGLILLFIALASQRTFPRVIQWVSVKGAHNPLERKLSELVVEHNIGKVYLYNEMYALFLPPEVGVRNNPTVPVSARDCTPFEPEKGEYLIEGLYARTTFSHCYDKEKGKVIAVIGEGEKAYRILSFD